MIDRRTREQLAFVSVVVVGGPDTLIEAVRRCAGGVSRSARVIRTQIARAATDVARERPFAIVVSDPLYAFDPEEFDALSRDVKAVLIAIHTAEVHGDVLYERLLPLLRDAYQEYFRR